MVAVTVTGTRPEENVIGVVQTIWVFDTEIKLQGPPATVTVPPARLVPVMVMFVPPLVGPLPGLIPVMVGGGA